MTVSVKNDFTYDKTLFGFWVYIMTDCVLFSSLFACWAILHDNSFGGPPASELFSLPYALGETLILLTSSFTCGLGMWALFRDKKRAVLINFLITFLLGVSFLGMEFNEFSQFVASGNSWQRSAFLTSYFALVGTHGLHITIGLLWMSVVLYELLTRGVVRDTVRRFACLSLFWHFLDIVWIFIFTFVYLMGVMA